MPQILREGEMIMIGDAIRIEPGPAKIAGIADEATLSDAVTAKHYRAPIETDQGVDFARDADGAPIKAGAPFTYLDWLGYHAAAPLRVWYLYRLEAMSEAEIDQRRPRDASGNFAGDAPETTIWREIGVYPNSDEALSAGMEAAYVVS